MRKLNSMIKLGPISQRKPLIYIFLYIFLYNKNGIIFNLLFYTSFFHVTTYMSIFYVGKYIQNNTFIRMAKQSVSFILYCGPFYLLSIFEHFENFFFVVVNILQEKVMATHSSTVALKIPWGKEPGGLQSMGSLRVRHD